MPERVLSFIRRWKYSITLLTACVAIGTWTTLADDVYHGPESWWRVAIAGAAGGSATALNRWEAGRKR